jgi:hypothetical protein
MMTSFGSYGGWGGGGGGSSTREGFVGVSQAATPRLRSANRSSVRMSQGYTR